jgi:hypothetical protein
MKITRQQFNDRVKAVAKDMARLAFGDDMAMSPEMEQEYQASAEDAMGKLDFEIDDAEAKIAVAGTDIDADIAYLEGLKTKEGITEEDIKNVDAAIEKAKNAKEELDMLTTLIAELKVKFPEQAVADVAPEAPMAEPMV